MSEIALNSMPTGMAGLVLRAGEFVKACESAGHTSRLPIGLESLRSMVSEPSTLRSARRTQNSCAVSYGSRLVQGIRNDHSPTHIH